MDTGASTDEETRELLHDARHALWYYVRAGANHQFTETAMSSAMRELGERIIKRIDERLQR